MVGYGYMLLVHMAKSVLGQFDFSSASTKCIRICEPLANSEDPDEMPQNAAFH